MGQNFLVSDRTAGRIVAAAELDPDEAVLEIGAGLGALTRCLAAAAARVVAVELDQRLMPVLQHTLAACSNIQLVQGDILKLDPAALMPPAYKVVANIPYYITSALLRHLLEASTSPALMVLTVQEQVARRIVAGPGDMSLLALGVQFYGRPRIVARLKAGAFYPRPKVDSAVVQIDLRPEAQPGLDVPDVELFFRIAKSGFGQRRKQLRNSLTGGLRRSREEVDAALEQAGIDPRRRAETLSLDEWAALSRAL
ncbi:MAG: ribosomal RNA small subunit methyltransferase A [Delftia sp.]|nr:ribosomal RNA small subunit methyltransferase A [Delftia sp.]